MTGEMSYDDLTPEEFPLHFAIAEALGGTVRPFDKYQGPYVTVPNGNLWLIEDGDGFCSVYNERNENQSAMFPGNLAISEAMAVAAAREVI